MCHHVTLEAGVTSCIGGRCQTDLCNGPVSGLAPEAGGHGGRDTRPGPGSGHMGHMESRGVTTVDDPGESFLLVLLKKILSLYMNKY